MYDLWYRLVFDNVMAWSYGTITLWVVSVDFPSRKSWIFLGCMQVSRLLWSVWPFEWLKVGHPIQGRLHLGPWMPPTWIKGGESSLVCFLALPWIGDMAREVGASGDAWWGWPTLPSGTQISLPRPLASCTLISWHLLFFPTFKHFSKYKWY
jgi:hypothetical protein